MRADPGMKDYKSLGGTWHTNRKSGCLDMQT